jgi:Zn-dependent peptidase ImmA (M78 family)
VTVFRPGTGKPRVAVAAFLQNNENRLRMTLAHEFGHVHLHACLFDLKDRQTSSLPPNHNPNGIYCKRDTIESAASTDWLEWQASYAASALLAPASAVRNVARPIIEQAGLFGPVGASTEHGASLIAAVSEAFTISRDAARVRLSVLNVLGTPTSQGSLFS